MHSVSINGVSLLTVRVNEITHIFWLLPNVKSKINLAITKFIDNYLLSKSFC